MLKNYALVAKLGVDADENKPRTGSEGRAQAVLVPSGRPGSRRTSARGPARGPSRKPLPPFPAGPHLEPAFAHSDTARSLQTIFFSSYSISLYYLWIQLWEANFGKYHQQQKRKL